MSLFKSNKEKMEKVAHIIAAFIIVVHAYEKYELEESSWIFFCIAGIIFLLIALLHHKIEKFFPYVDSVFFMIEALVYAIIAIDFFHHGKKALPWCYLFTSMAYIVAAILKAKKGKAKHTLHHSSVTNGEA